MEIYILKTGFLIRPETPKDGFELGKAYLHRFFPGVSFSGTDMEIHCDELQYVDKALGTHDHKSRRKRIEELLLELKGV